MRHRADERAMGATSKQPRALPLPLHACGVTVALALAALIGWELDVPSLRRFGWRGTQLFPLPALLMAPLSAALVGARQALLQKTQPRWRAVTWSVCACAFVPAVTTLVQHLFQLPPSFELLVMGRQVLLNTEAAFPGR